MSNNIVLGIVLSVLVLFGLRGVLPELFASIHLSVLIAFAIAGVAGFLIGRFSRRESHS